MLLLLLLSYVFIMLCVALLAFVKNLVYVWLDYISYIGCCEQLIYYNYFVFWIYSASLNLSWFCY